MVSIPDWSKLARAIGPTVQQSSTAKDDLYFKQREEESIKEVVFNFCYGFLKEAYIL